MPVDEAVFREVFAQVPTSVSVITTYDSNARPYGVTVGSLCALSLVPPLLLFCLRRDGRSSRVLGRSAQFVVNVLRHDQEEVARRHAGTDRFLTDHTTRHGLPALSEPLAHLVCRRREVLRGGDHDIVLGLVEHVDLGIDRPLVYYGREYRTVTASAAVVPAE